MRIVRSLLRDLAPTVSAFASFAFTLAPMPAWAAPQLGSACDKRIPIATLPFNITSSGSYYLVGSLTGVSGMPGIVIAADHVTIDLNGFVLQGVAGSMQGIADGGASNVTIRDGTVTGWGGEGISLGIGTHAHLERLRVTDNGGAGGIVASGSGVIEEVVAEQNAGYGVFLGAAVAGEVHFIVEKCVAASNGSSGFRAVATGSSYVITNCIARSNGQDGFEVRDSGCVIACNAVRNTAAGFNVINAALRDCDARENGLDGFHLFQSSATNCVSTLNADDGFELETLCSVQSCVANQNSGNGIRCFGSRNSAEGNRLSLNTGFGLAAPLGSPNTVVRNVTFNNVAGNYSASGPWFGPIQSPATATSPWANF